MGAAMGAEVWTRPPELDAFVGKDRSNIGKATGRLWCVGREETGDSSNSRSLLSHKTQPTTAKLIMARSRYNLSFTFCFGCCALYLVYNRTLN